MSTRLARAQQTNTDQQTEVPQKAAEALLRVARSGCEGIVYTAMQCTAMQRAAMQQRSDAAAQRRSSAATQQRNQVSADTHVVEYIPVDAGEHFLMVGSSLCSPSACV